MSPGRAHGPHIAIAAGLALFGALSVLPVRIPTLDTHAYVSMAQGNYSAVGTPFRYRVVVPALAGMLPTSPLLGLRLITYVSMAGVYFLGLTECASLGIVGWPALCALMVIFCSRANLFNFYNPYLTDATGLAVLFLLSWCFIADLYWPFLGAACLGIFVRESALFAVPVWLFSPKWRKGIWIILLGVAIFILPTLLFPSPTTYRDYAALAIKAKANGKELFRLAKDVSLSWHCVWILCFCGLLRLPRRVQVLAGLLVLGAGASSLVADDYERMVSVLCPVVLSGVAKTLETAWVKNQAMVIAFLCTLPLQFLFSSPYVLQGMPIRIHHVTLVATLAISSLCAAGVVVD
jgi:hypothetical protein